ncbi:MAG: PSD1 and planctomycete cytochrome C domain-containing protein [Pirellulales bacterium]
MRSCIELLISSALFSILMLGSMLHAAEKEPTAEHIHFFENKIRPLLIQHCYECHGPEEQEGDLRLDSLVSILKGGKSGFIIKLNHPEESLLINAVEYKISDLKMPPDQKLSKQEIANLSAWVKMGTPHPDHGKQISAASTIKKPSADFWSFKSLQNPVVPKVSNTSWPQTDLDNFILAQLEAKGLSPASPADKRTLLRRATFDLIGLPPSQQEIKNYLADESKEAFSHVIERLLASPQYGERWGRHWLDVARYADSNGLDENIAHGNAWRYRDYVVEAFNQDKPYDHFIQEQLAGDLMPAVDDVSVNHARLIATGFLSLGPKVLAEVDEAKMEMDIIDEQVSTVASAFMGLTFGCARCHDHKFDPFPTTDYYALAGIFKSTKTMEHFKKIAKWHENELSTDEYLASKTNYDQKVANHNVKIKEVVENANTKVASESKDMELPKDLETLYPVETKSVLKILREELVNIETTAPEISSAMGVAEGELRDLPVHIRGSHLALGNQVPRGFPVVLLNLDAQAVDPNQSGRLQLAHWLTNPQHPLTSRVMVNRIWRWHFGEGIVRTPDNFGRLGEHPTDQPLLDWLAVQFIKNKWSIKQMHRMIMLSQTYQMSSNFNSQANSLDPENHFHWRANIRRLEVEAMRDSLLAVGGLLDLEMGGSLVHVKNREFFFNHTSQDMTNYDSFRRSLYLPVVRNNLYDVFQLFDYADASVINGNRGSTTVAPQALFIMNSDLVEHATANLAKKLLENQDLDDSALVQLLYEKSYARTPTSQETTRALAYLITFEQMLVDSGLDKSNCREQAWQNLCHVIVSANEFLYLR